MFESQEAKQNNVSSVGQLKPNEYVTINRVENPKHKILFIGNSITKHAPSPQIGWYGDWGMAASAEDKDFVHQTLQRICKKYGPVDYCIAQLSHWESNYTDGAAVLNEFYTAAAEFKPDIIIVRIGENINRETNKITNCKPFFDEMIKFFINDECEQVIVTDNFWQIEVLDEIFKEVIAENGYTYCKISDLYLDKKTMALDEFEHHGVSLHPSDYGMEKIAERIFESLNI